MKTGPKFKIARRLGAPIFEKTQTAKFKLKEDGKDGKKKGGRGGKSDFSKQLIEKQKARFTYGVSEKQFSSYVKKVIETGTHMPVQHLYEKLETRLDNVVARLGLVPTRRMARQVVSHGHILVNDRKVNIPSYTVRVGDVISVRDGSKSNGVFKQEEGKVQAEAPVWLAWDATKSKASVVRLPSVEGQDMLFDLSSVLEFYKR
jgi:small subunit ribosomal protein S4